MSFEESLISEVKSRPTLWDTRSQHYKNRDKIREEWENISKALDLPKETVRSKWRNLRDTFHKELRKVTRDHADDLNLMNYTGKWVFFKDLSFLKDFMVLPNTQGSTPIQPFEMVLLQDHDTTSTMTREPSIESNSTSDNETKPLTTRSRRSTQQRQGISSSSMSTVTNIDSDPLSIDEQPLRERKRTSSTTELHRQKILKSEENKMKTVEVQTPLDADEDEDMVFVKSLVPHIKTLPCIQKLRLKSKILNLIADELSTNPDSRAEQMTRTRDDTNFDR